MFVSVRTLDEEAAVSRLRSAEPSKPSQEFRVPSDGHPANIDQFANPTDSCPAKTAM